MQSDKMPQNATEYGRLSPWVENQPAAYLMAATKPPLIPNFPRQIGCSKSPAESSHRIKRESLEGWSLDRGRHGSRRDRMTAAQPHSHSSPATAARVSSVVSHRRGVSTVSSGWVALTECGRCGRCGASCNPKENNGYQWTATRSQRATFGFAALGGSFGKSNLESKSSITEQETASSHGLWSLDIARSPSCVEDQKSSGKVDIPCCFAVHRHWIVADRRTKRGRDRRITSFGIATGPSFADRCLESCCPRVVLGWLSRETRPSARGAV
ncbi:hypothetical protein AUEXF2481DRAFT_325100 [Aureobasidium subglaciale EXF-2481]|uniref:Uncharacterized protein n=1 Tax=Aureobasidium subglaciale (strain EXF-2481) TaxID=1043005 RepID=A0A074Y6V4_AURSE|nr:uncharacterized protein AUEXF2481DRAFT_325100 [Aureobasidium subglaciale EXF-2481]KEQ93518.1 hypothetical protein AUEXF2481DRAFT_325100 [Aureobasidium subglaciale EXF-2481]